MHKLLTIVAGTAVAVAGSIALPLLHRRVVAVGRARWRSGNERGGQQLVKPTTTAAMPADHSTRDYDREWWPCPPIRVGVVNRAVFINYRSEDSHSYGALLYTELTRHFGDANVFLDAESIPAGADFVQELLGQAKPSPSASESSQY
jgi:hypothetical protein